MRRLTRAEVREIDRRSIEEFHVPGVVLMENAAIAATNVALQMLQGEQRAKVVILCGGGNNGGDGLAVARHLHNHGAQVLISLTVDPQSYHGDALTNWNIASAMKLPWEQVDPASLEKLNASLIVDAIFGTGLNKVPRDPFPKIVDAIQCNGAPVLAIDLPSGLDCDTGVPPGACVLAKQTITFVAEKIGFANPAAKSYLGQVSIGSIGCPRELFE